MKLARVGPPGDEVLCLIDRDGGCRNLAGFGVDLDPASISAGVLRTLAAIDPERLPQLEGYRRIGSPMRSVGKIVAIGLNYHDHCAEVGVEAPATPAFFLKSPTSLSGPVDPILRPPGCDSLDWEVELAVVIGGGGLNLSEAEAASCIAGYSLFNDVSARSFQLEPGKQWVQGKSYDGFGPLGPLLVTPDEIDDPYALDLWLEVNGQRMQSGSTADLVHRIPTLISHVSRYLRWEPGDLLITGTPAGTAVGRKPPPFLQPDDIVTLGGAGLGEQRHIVQDH
jgi:2,4-didehydro-3-deoxy-L-rhamnonate hydrolase